MNKTYYNSNNLFNVSDEDSVFSSTISMTDLKTKLLSAAKYLDEAEIFLSATRTYASASKEGLDKLKNLVCIAEANLYSTEECIAETGTRLNQLRTQLQHLFPISFCSDSSYNGSTEESIHSTKTEPSSSVFLQHLFGDTSCRDSSSTQESIQSAETEPGKCLSYQENIVQEYSHTPFVKDCIKKRRDAHREDLNDAKVGNKADVSCIKMEACWRKIGTYSEQSVREGTYSEQSDRADTYSEQSDRANAYSEQSDRADSYSEQSFRADTYSEQSVKAETYSEQSVRDETYNICSRPSEITNDTNQTDKTFSVSTSIDCGNHSFQKVSPSDIQHISENETDAPSSMQHIQEKCRDISYFFQESKPYHEDFIHSESCIQASTDANNFHETKSQLSESNYIDKPISFSKSYPLGKTYFERSGKQPVRPQNEGIINAYSRERDSVRQVKKNVKQKEPLNANLGIMPIRQIKEEFDDISSCSSREFSHNREKTLREISRDQQNTRAVQTEDIYFDSNAINLSELTEVSGFPMRNDQRTSNIESDLCAIIDGNCNNSFESPFKYFRHEFSGPNRLSTLYEHLKTTEKMEQNHPDPLFKNKKNIENKDLNENGSLSNFTMHASSSKEKIAQIKRRLPSNMRFAIPRQPTTMPLAFYQPRNRIKAFSRKNAISQINESLTKCSEETVGNEKECDECNKFPEGLFNTRSSPDFSSKSTQELNSIENIPSKKYELVPGNVSESNMSLDAFTKHSFPFHESFTFSGKTKSKNNSCSSVDQESLPSSKVKGIQSKELQRKNREDKKSGSKRIDNQASFGENSNRSRNENFSELQEISDSTTDRTCDACCSGNNSQISKEKSVYFPPTDFFGLLHKEEDTNLSPDSDDS